MATEQRGVTIEDLKAYKVNNPAKFELKFGSIDFDNIPAGFNIQQYKRFVVGERVRREKLPIELQAGLPPITPELLYKKVVAEAPVVEAPVVSDEVAKEEQAEVVSAPAPEVSPEVASPETAN